MTLPGERAVSGKMAILDGLLDVIGFFADKCRDVEGDSRLSHCSPVRYARSAAKSNNQFILTTSTRNRTNLPAFRPAMGCFVASLCLQDGVAKAGFAIMIAIVEHIAGALMVEHMRIFDHL